MTSPKEETALPEHTNRLASETSPYLLQHAHNPVDWYPWGPEALERARAENKPIFLSIGYSACHWCHVMERESFEDESVARLMNEKFINIKVDREERPDLDDIYMKATLVIAKSGGWPMSVWLTPDRKPYYAGTYFPTVPRYGRPSFTQMLESMANAYASRTDEVVHQAERVVRYMQQLTLSPNVTPEALGPDVERPTVDVVTGAIEQLSKWYDETWGGFRSAPKFPGGDHLRLLLRHHLDTVDHPALRMAEHTLDCMARGGMNDQLGGGFARYSTDEKWWIPHFEKMLYDNALLIPAYIEGYRVTGRADFARVVRETCEWALREMVGESGAFSSAQDADSEGVEGKFFAWERDEVYGIVGKENRELVDVAWNLGDEANFEGQHWVLVRPEPDTDLASKLGIDVATMHARLAPLRQRLFDEREKRVHPATDDKVLVSWNGLMIGALARAGTTLDEPRYIEAAQRAARFCLTTMRPDGTRLLATYRDGKAHLNGTLADYAYLAAGLLDLFEADGDVFWARTALELANTVEEHFADSELGGWFFTSDDHEELAVRPRDMQDGATPSSNGVMVDVMLCLYDLTGDPRWRSAGDRALAMMEPLMRESPTEFSRAMIALLRTVANAPIVVVTRGEGFEELWRALALHRDTAMTAIQIPADGVTDDVANDVSLLAAKHSIDGKATAYVCREGTCLAPVTEVTALKRQLD